MSSMKKVSSNSKAQNAHSRMSDEVPHVGNTENSSLDQGVAPSSVEKGSNDDQHPHLQREIAQPVDEEKEKHSVNGDRIAPTENWTNNLIGTNETGIEKGLGSEERDSESEDESNYPHGFTMIAFTMALMISTFMVALDTNVIGTAIPRVTSQFNSLNDVGWYGSAYLLTLMSLQPTYGKIYTHFNVKYTFLAALLCFELGSTVCATSSRSSIFIVGRAISGTGAAGVLSGSLTIGAGLVPLTKRPLHMSIIMTFGGLAFLVFAAMLKTPKKQGLELSLQAKLRKMDFAGAVLLISAMVCLLLALQWGGSTYPWTDSKVLGCLFGFAGLICLFIAVQARRKEDAMIPGRILFQRTVAVTCCFIAFLNMAIDTHIYYLPFYFQAVKGTSASGSGIRILPYLATMIITAVGSGSCITVLGYYVPFLWLGAALATVGSALLHTLNVDSGPGRWIGYQLLSGAGFGMAFQIPYSALHVVLSAEEIPTGNGLLVFFQALGGALAVSIAQNILSNSLIQQLKHTPSVDAAAVVAAGATNVGAAVSPELIDIVREAYAYALSSAYILPIAASGVAFLSSLATEWKKLEKQH